MITKQIKISHKQSDSFCGPQQFRVILAAPRMLFLRPSSYLMAHQLWAIYSLMGHFCRGFEFYFGIYGRTVNCDKMIFRLIVNFKI